MVSGAVSRHCLTLSLSVVICPMTRSKVKVDVRMFSISKVYLATAIYSYNVG